MKLLQIPNYMYPNIGGIEQVARDIADTLLENPEIEQKIICYNTDASVGGYVCHMKETVHNEVDGVEVIRCGCFAKIASQSLSLTYPYELKKLFKGFQPDIVILHYPNPYVSSFLLQMLPKKTKFVVYWHSEIIKQKRLGRLFAHQNMKLLARADIIVATSPNYIDGSRFLTAFREKCVVIPNCIRTERLTVTPAIESSAAQIKEKYKDKTIVFAFGRHVPYKGIGQLVKASKYLDDHFAVLIGGKGELTESLKTEAADDKKIEFLGRISDEDLIAHFIACDIFAFPSITKNEAFGIGLAEAMYFGKPAVTFTIPGSGVNFVSLDKVTGIECLNGDYKSFAQAIQTLRSDKALCTEYGKAAKQRVEKNFMFEQFIFNIRELLNKI